MASFDQETKEPVNVQTFLADGNQSPTSADLPEGKRGTGADAHDMFRMGKKQETKRNFQFLSIFGFTMVLMATWEAQLNSNLFVLVNGGTGGAIWMYLATFFGFYTAVISMAEMASQAPTTGGQVSRTNTPP